jgi:hypothetical protein
VQSRTEEIAHGISETGADGSVMISFVAQADKSVSEDLEPIFEYAIVADVTGGAGETRSATKRLSVGYTSLKASLSAADWLESGEELEFTIRTTSLDGDGRKATGVVKIHRLKEPEVCPQAKRGEVSIDPNRWAPGEIISEFEVQTDEEGEALLEAQLDAGAYRLIFETKDANGRTIQALLGIEVVNPDGKNFPTKMPFYTGAPSWSVEPGNSFSVLWGSGHEEARACVEWYQNRKLLKREWSAEGRTQQIFTYPIKEANRGGITVVIRQVTMNRLHQMQRVIRVP